MLKFIKSLFKKKINPKATGNSHIKIWNPDLDLPGNYVKVEDDLMTQKYKEFAERKGKEISTNKSPVRTGYSKVEEDKKNKSYPYTDDEPKITMTKSEDNSFIIVTMGDSETHVSSPYTNHDSYSYDQDNSSNDSSSDSSPDFGGGDFGGSGAGGDYE